MNEEIIQKECLPRFISISIIIIAVASFISAVVAVAIGDYIFAVGGILNGICMAYLKMEEKKCHLKPPDHPDKFKNRTPINTVYAVLTMGLFFAIIIDEKLAAISGLIMITVLYYISVTATNQE
jgi:hypothetical protein